MGLPQLPSEEAGVADLEGAVGRVEVGGADPVVAVQAEGLEAVSYTHLTLPTTERV